MIYELKGALLNGAGGYDSIPVRDFKKKIATCNVGIDMPKNTKRLEPVFGRGYMCPRPGSPKSGF